MNFSEMGVVALVVYVALLLGVSEVASRMRRDGSPSDHFLGGRELGVFVLFLTLYATAYSGNSLLGYPGKAYRTGFHFIMSTGFMMAIVVVFHVLVPKLRPAAVQRGYVTPGDWVRDRFRDDRWGVGLTRAVSVLMIMALANFLLASLKAMGEVASLVTGDLIPYSWGVVGLAGMILFYETRGGMRAVAWTDAAQGILMLAGLTTLLAWLMSSAGGLTAVTESVAAARPSAVALPDGQGIANWFSTIVLLGLASVIYPQAIQRIYAAKSGRVLTHSLVWMTFMPLATTLVVTLIGVAAIPRLDLASGVASDGVMPALLVEWSEEGASSRLAAVLVFIGALSAIMSTADSCLLSLGSVMARDLLGKTGADVRQTRLGKLLAAFVLVLIIPIALQRDITLWRLIELKMELLIQCVPAFLMALHWRRQSARATLAGLLAGTGFAVIATLSGTSQWGGVHVGVIGLLVNGCVVVLGSLFSESGGRHDRWRAGSRLDGSTGVAGILGKGRVES
ncbi:MAG: sodium:solute symporter family protein [Myxococcota bacterium]|nr:sodium:solute symporter family protein [Myxococcota bacterium]